MRAVFERARSVETEARSRILSAARWVARVLARYGASPEQITIAGCLVNVASSLTLVSGYPIVAGLLFWAGGSLDMVDGALARLTGRASALGAFIDSVLDRIGEGAMFIAISYHFAVQGHPAAVTATVSALFGGMMTSYVRARAEALGIPCTEGWVTRPERVILLVFGLLTGLLTAVIYVLAIVTLWTAWQRSRHLYQSLRAHA